MALAAAPARRGVLRRRRRRRRRAHGADGADLRGALEPLHDREHAGTPVGIDARLVVELEITPQITTGVLHVRAGAGQIGAGVAHQPVEPFRAAVAALGAELA